MVYEVGTSFEDRERVDKKEIKEFLETNGGDEEIKTVEFDVEAIGASFYKSKTSDKYGQSKLSLVYRFVFTNGIFINKEYSHMKALFDKYGRIDPFHKKWLNKIQELGQKQGAVSKDKNVFQELLESDEDVELNSLKENEFHNFSHNSARLKLTLSYEMNTKTGYAKQFNNSKVVRFNLSELESKATELIVNDEVVEDIFETPKLAETNIKQGSDLDFDS